MMIYFKIMTEKSFFANHDEYEKDVMFINQYLYYGELDKCVRFVYDIFYGENIETSLLK